MKLGLFVAVSVIAGLAPARGQAQDDRQQVLATIDAMLRGMRTKDSALIAEQIDSTTRMTLLRPAQGGGVRVVAMTGRDFLRVVMQQPTGIDEPIRNPVVTVDGDLATVWAEYQVRRGGKVTHCGFDAFHVARIAGKWKIINISDTYRTSGCGDPWPAPGGS